MNHSEFIEILLSNLIYGMGLSNSINGMNSSNMKC